MINLDLPSVLVPLVGLVVPALAMASLSLPIRKKTRFFLDPTGPSIFFFQDLDLNHNTDIYLVE